jgi:hypothetical protein
LASTSSRSAFRYAPELVLAVINFTLALRFFHFISAFAINIFFDDQWDYLTPFFRGSPTIAELFFWQPGPHREGVGLVADKFLYAWTNWSVRAETWMIGGCIRVCLGLPSTAQSSRYATLLIPAFLAMYFSLLSLRPGASRNLAPACLAAALIPGSLRLPWNFRSIAFVDAKRSWASCYVRTGSIAQCDEEIRFSIYPHPASTGLQPELDYLKQHRLNLFADPPK